MPRTKRMRCPFCDAISADASRLVSHIEREHSGSIPPNMTPTQYVYYLKTGKDHGTCVMCGKPTSWNESTGKYNRFCNDPKCKEKYREIFKQRMINRYGKTTLLNDPEQQKKMLKNRKISGVYLWRDHVHKTPYTGTYELDFLRFLDECLEMDPEDVMAPSPHTFYYVYNGEKHFYIPDFFIPSLNLEIEIKTHENMHHKIQAVDRVKEQLKDQVMEGNKNTFDYLKIADKNYMVLLDYFQACKERTLSDPNSGKIVMVQKGQTL